MDWLKGGPYYELSFLMRNKIDKDRLIKELLANLVDDLGVKIIRTSQELKEEINTFVEGEQEDDKLRRKIDVNTQIEISGSRKSRLYIAELSHDLLIVNFWFFGSEHDSKEWDQQGIRKEDKQKFKDFFKMTQEIVTPILGTIAYEEDCSALFETAADYPNEFYKLENLKIEKIRERVTRSTGDFEYCWIRGDEFGEVEDVEIEMG